MFAVGADKFGGFLRRVFFLKHAFYPLVAAKRARAHGFLRAWGARRLLKRLAALANHPEGDFERGDENFPAEVKLIEELLRLIERHCVLFAKQRSKLRGVFLLLSPRDGVNRQLE